MHHYKELCFYCFFFAFHGCDSTRAHDVWESKCEGSNELTNRCYKLQLEYAMCRHAIMTECDEPGCSPRLSFVNIPCMKYRCIDTGCCHGYIENNVGTCIAEEYIESVQCLNGATKTEYGVCRCTKHFKGNRCQIPDCGGTCLNGGVCEIHDNKTRCNCPSSFHTGKFCQNVSCSGLCLNGGTCLQNGALSRCICLRGYQGDRCQFPVREECAEVSSNTYSECIPVRNECESDGDCGNTTVRNKCCFDGCRGVCRVPDQRNCRYNGIEHPVGTTFNPEPCKTCVCQLDGNVICTLLESKVRQCSYGQSAIMVYWMCCQTCSGLDVTSKPAPRFTNCPEQFIYVNVTAESDVAYIPPLNLTVDDTELEISYSEDRLSHAHISDIKSNLHIVLAYTQCDPYGWRAKCNFRVIVVDPFPPVFRTCPSNITIDSDTLVTWEDPDIVDNVGLNNTEVSGEWIRDRRLSPGTYTVTYTTSDYDMNTAVCSFTVNVKLRKYETNQLTGDYSHTLPIGTIVGVCGALIVFMAVCLCFTIRMTRLRRLQENSQAVDNHSSFGNSNHSVDQPQERNGDVCIELPNLPKYTPRSDPPSYEEVERGIVGKIEENIYDEINEVTPPASAPEIHEDGSNGIDDPATDVSQSDIDGNEADCVNNEATPVNEAGAQETRFESTNDEASTNKEPAYENVDDAMDDDKEMVREASIIENGTSAVIDDTTGVRDKQCREVGNRGTNDKTTPDEENKEGYLNDRVGDSTQSSNDEFAQRSVVKEPETNDNGLDSGEVNKAFVNE